MRKLPAVLILAALTPACGGGGSTTPTPTPSSNPAVIAVGGEYTTAVNMAENSCGDVTIMALPTRVEHTAGATSMRLTHGATYDCSVTAAGGFTCTPRTFDVNGRQEAVTVAGTASVAVQPNACAYAVRWTGTKQGAANVIP
jgi:hypothetical protein